MGDNEANPKRVLDDPSSFGGSKATARRSPLDGESHDLKLPSNATRVTAAQNVLLTGPSPWSATGWVI
jgi:hypothetical protein